MDKLKQKQSALQAQLQQKLQQFQNADNIRNSLANEITEMRGKLQMLDELIKEGGVKSEDIPEKPEEAIKEKPEEK